MCVCVCVFGIYVCMYVRTSAHYEHEKQELADSGFTVEGTPSFSLSLSRRYYNARASRASRGASR